MMTILSAGPLSTIQDEGRFGHMNTGFSPGGAADIYAMKIANLLVGNFPGEGVVEMTLLGMTVRFDCDTAIALTGAPMKPLLNQAPIPMYETIPVHKGDILTCGMVLSGIRSYLAVSGGFDLPPVMGSLSTNLKCALGGFEGRSLQNGDQLPLRVSNPSSLPKPQKFVPDCYWESPMTLRVIPGPQDDMFSNFGRETFFTSTYKVSLQSDRMGVRLEGEKVESTEGVDIISDGIAAGSIQIPASGTPIIMMADRQTTGGYAKIATVISADLKKAAQARPGTLIRFEAVTHKEAVRLKKEEQKTLKKLSPRPWKQKGVFYESDSN